jgi:flagellar motor switch/type III secretory pathway protein FliN
MNCRCLESGDLLAISPAGAAAHSRLLRTAHPHLGFSPPAAPSERRPGWWLVLKMGDSNVQLQMPGYAWPEWQPEQAGAHVPDTLLAAGVSQMGAPLWQAFAQATQLPVQLLRARWLHDMPAAPADALAWRLQSSAWHGTLHLRSERAWRHWAAALPKPVTSPSLPWLERFGAATAADEALCVPVALVIGRTRLPVVDLARLRRHAVLLIDTLALTAQPPGTSRGHAVYVLAGRARVCVAHALWQPPALLRRCAAPLPTLQGDPMNDLDTTPVPSTPDSANHPEALDLGPVEVEVRFELARQHWPLGRLAQWRIGEALPLAAPLADAVLTAWVHERCVASGRLVVIGDKLGLHIDALGAAAARMTPAPVASAPAPASDETLDAKSGRSD